MVIIGWIICPLNIPCGFVIASLCIRNLMSQVFCASDREAFLETSQNLVNLFGNHFRNYAYVMYKSHIF